jgi:hypothetical protein
VPDTLNDEGCVIGGEGVYVEIDESKFSKCKYNRGHRVDGCWVLGGVERSGEQKLFVVTFADHNTNTLLDAISRHVCVGSIIVTDLWKGYCQLNKELGFTHFTVNHSKVYKDPDTRTHMNTNEGMWNGIKMTVSPRARILKGMDERLLEFVWRRKHKSNIWVALLDAFKEIKYLD